MTSPPAHTPHEIVLPQLRRDASSCQIVAWLKQVGDRLERGEAVLLMETDKAAIELEAEVAGVLTEIRYPAGQWIHVPQTVGLITPDREPPED